MKIAFITPYCPYPPDTGGKIRSYYLLEGLARRHAVDLFTVYCGDRPEQTEVIARLCHALYVVKLEKAATNFSRLVRSFTDSMPRLAEHFYSPAAHQEIRQRLESGHYDLVIVDEICMAPYVDGLSVPRIVNRHKIDHLHYRDVARMQSGPNKPVVERIVDRWEVRKLRRYERETMAQFMAVVCCSEDDAAEVKHLNPEIPVSVIGNGVDLSRFVPLGESNGPPSLLYIGTMNYFPNIDAVNYFFQQIYGQLVKRVPDVQIIIVGHNPPPDLLSWTRLPGVEFTGSVCDTRPFFARCTATMVPLRLGRGTRLKILESLAMGRAVVSTSVGAEGLGMRHGEHLMIADDPQEFAERCSEILRDHELRRRLIKSGRPYVSKHFSWQVLAAQFESLCSRLVQEAMH